MRLLVQGFQEGSCTPEGNVFPFDLDKDFLIDEGINRCGYQEDLRGAFGRIWVG